MMFYTARKKMGLIPRRLLSIVTEGLRNDSLLAADVKSLGECSEFQKKTGKCGMETYLAYMEQKKKTRKLRP